MAATACLQQAARTGLATSSGTTSTTARQLNAAFNVRIDRRRARHHGSGARLRYGCPTFSRDPDGWQLAVRKDRHQARRVSANSPSGTYEIARHDTKSRDITLPPGAEKARQGSRIDLVSRAFPGAVG